MNTEVKDMLFKSKSSLIIGSLVLAGALFMNGCANSKNENFKTSNTETESPTIVGVDTFSGVVKSVETMGDLVFLVVGKDKDNVYYATKDSDVAKEALKLTVGDNVDVKYALGTPQKYKETTAMPLSSIMFLY